MKIDWSKNKTKIAAIPVIIAIVIVLVAVLARSGGEEASISRLATTAVRGPLAIKVSGSGEIQAKKSFKIVPKIRQTATISFLVPDGTRAKKGDVIAQLNTDNLDNKLEELQSEHNELLSELDSTKTYLEIQVIDTDTGRKTAEQDVQRAELELNEYLQGDLPLSRRNAELNLQTAKSKLGRKEKRYEDLQGLLKEGFVTEDEVEEARIDIEAAKVDLETATLKKLNLEKYTIPRQKTGSENKLARAKTELEKTLKTNQNLLQSARLDVQEAQRRVDKVLEELEDTKEQRESFTITAPVDGVIQYGNPNQAWRRSEVRIGANIARGQILMTIPETSSLIAVININESDIRKIKVDQEAFVTVDALSSRPIRGKVVHVAEVANSGSFFGSDAKEFSVRVDLGANQDLKPGFSCEGEILTEELDDIVMLPVQAVFQEDNRFYVYPAGPGSTARQEVKIGVISATHVEIREGLEAGRRVYLSPPITEGSS